MNGKSGGSEAHRTIIGYDNKGSGGAKVYPFLDRYKIYEDEIAATKTDDSKNDQPYKEDTSMDWQEKYIDNLDKSVRDIKDEVKDTRIEIKEMRTELKNEFDNKFNQFINELRDRDNQRHLEIITMNQRIDENMKELKADIKATKTGIDTTNKWIMGLVISASLAFLVYF